MTIERSTINLPDKADAYRGRNRIKRHPADPLGLAGFPDTRRALDAMVLMLCSDLRITGGRVLAGVEIARRLFDGDDTRRVRHLVAYARVHKRIHQIVGTPGSGYVWADPATEAGCDLLATAIDSATQMARCFLFIAALHRRQGGTMAAVQMVFDFMQHNVPEDERRSDDLATMFAAENVSIAGFVDALITQLAKTDEGKAALAAAGAKHAQYLITAEAHEQLLAKIEAASSSLDSVRQAIRQSATAA